MTHIKAHRRDIYPVKIEMTQYGAEMIYSAINTVRSLHPNSELTQVLEWLRFELTKSSVHTTDYLDAKPAARFAPNL